MLTHAEQVLLNSGVNLWKFSQEIFALTKTVLYTNFKTSPHRVEAIRLAGLTTQWLGLSARIAVMARFNKEVVGSASVDYLMYSGYVTMAYFWLRMMEVAAAKLAANPSSPDAEFYRSKLATGKFFFAHLLPRTKGLAKSMVQDPKAVMGITEEQFAAR